MILRQIEFSLTIVVGDLFRHGTNFKTLLDLLNTLAITLTNCCVLEAF